MSCLDAEPAQAFRTVYRTARKAHQCVECRQGIKPKDKYRYDSGIWDGSPGSYHVCLDCDRVQTAWFKWARRLKLCPCFVYGDLGDAISELSEDYAYQLTCLARGY